LKDKCVILVTHQVQHLRNVPKIILLDQGKIKMQGSYEELKQQGMDFDSILEGYGHKEEKKDEIFIDEEENDREDEHKHRHKLPPLEFSSPVKRTIEDNNGKL
jgi:ABC-type multidrug transport system ATPase subunit